MNKISLLFVSLISGCASLYWEPTEKYIYHSDKPVLNNYFEAFDKAKKCWAKKATISNDGIIVEDTIFQGEFSTIGIRRHANDISEQPFILIQYIKSKNIIKVFEDTNIAKKYTGSWKTIAGWLNGNNSCGKPL